MSVALPRFDPYLAELIDNPYPVYRRYRETEPVHWGLPQAMGGDGCWYLFRAEEIRLVLKDARFRRRAPKAKPRAVPEAQKPFAGRAAPRRAARRSDKRAYRRQR